MADKSSNNQTYHKERAIRTGNDATVKVDDIPTRFYTFSDPYTAEIFCRMTNPSKSRTWRLA